VLRIQRAPLPVIPAQAGIHSRTAIRLGRAKPAQAPTGFAIEATVRHISAAAGMTLLLSFRNVGPPGASKPRRRIAFMPAA